MVTIDLCGNLMFFLVVAGLGRGYATILRVQCTYTVRVIHKGKHKYLHACIQTKQTLVCKVRGVQIMTAFCVFQSNFCQTTCIHFFSSLSRFICVFVFLSF